MDVVLVTLCGPCRSGRHGPGCDAGERASLLERRHTSVSMDGVLEWRPGSAGSCCTWCDAGRCETGASCTSGLPSAQSDAGRRPRRRMTARVAGPDMRREAHGPAGLRHLLARRAPLPARRLRVHPEHPDGGGTSRARHGTTADRLRLQHLSNVASVASRRGLRDRRHPHQRSRELRGGARLSQGGARGRSRPSAGS